MNTSAATQRRLRSKVMVGAVAAVATVAVSLAGCVSDDDAEGDGDALCAELAAELAGADMSAPVVDRWFADEAGIQEVAAKSCPDVADQLNTMATARFQALADAEAEAERQAEADAAARAALERQAESERQDDTPTSSASRPFASCSAARDAGAAPLYQGDPGYSESLDRDGDGVACEN